MNTRIKAHLAVLSANIIFGANYSIMKLITPVFIKPFGLNVARVLFTSIALWILYAFKPSSVKIKRQHVGRFVVCAVAGVALNQMAFVKGLSLTTPIHAALLALASPIFITFIAAWLLKERLTWNKIIGLVLGVGAAIFLVLQKESTGGGSQIILGDLLVVVNAICYAFYLVMVRPLMEEYTPLHVIRWVFTIGMLFIIPFGWNEFVHAAWPSFQWTEWIAMIFVVLGSTFLAYMFNIYGIQHIGSSTTGTYIYTQPVFAAIIAMVFYGEHFSLGKAVAAVLIFTGVYLVSMKKADPMVAEV